MNKNKENQIHPQSPVILLVDDEADFRQATSKSLNRRGLEVEQAADGEQAINRVREKHPDIVLLDLKMPGMSGIETLKEIRAIAPSLPVIILTGHGDFTNALAGIKLEIADFIQKPVDIELLCEKIMKILERGAEKPLRECTVKELMVSPSRYPRLNIDQPMEKVLEAMKEAFFKPWKEGAEPGQIRSALVYDEKDNFLGIIRFADLLKLVLPAFLGDSPYTTFFTGMFLAQCKVIGNRDISELMGQLIYIDIDAPLMEAINLMVHNHLVNLPVMSSGKLVGIIRERDIIMEIARVMGK